MILPENLNRFIHVDEKIYPRDVMECIRREAQKNPCANCGFDYEEEGIYVYFVVCDGMVVWWHGYHPHNKYTSVNNA